jgi:DMSO reductase family type II enzyme chaperone
MLATDPLLLHDLAESRLAVYRFLQAAFDKPTAAQHEWLAGDQFRELLAMLADRFGVAGPADDPGTADAVDHEARYIACFEVGLPTPPVVLLASHYNHREPVTAVIHEHILFYHRFGLRLAEGNPEPADHLLNELAFLIRLDELMQQGMPADSLQLARRDFLQRHVSRWPAKAAADASAKGLPMVYRTLLAILVAAVAEDLRLTEAALPEGGKIPS